MADDRVLGYFVVQYQVIGTDLTDRSVNVATLAEALQTAQLVRGHFAGVEWIDRTAALYGNLGKLPDAYRVFLWRDRDQWTRQLTIRPLTLKDSARDAARFIIGG